MPEYTFVCDSCGAKFAEIFSFNQYDTAISNNSIKCCSCGKTDISRSYEDDCMNIMGTVRKSDSELSKLGDLADRNRDRMSDDQKEHLWRKNNAYRLEKPDDPLPTGMSRVKRPQKPSWKFQRKTTRQKK